MSTVCGLLCEAIVKERFGRHAEQAVRVLFTSGQLPLKTLLLNVQLPKKCVQKSLRVLLRYGLVATSPGKIGSSIEYKLNWRNILRFVRYPKYLLVMKKLYGKESEVLVEELLRIGKTRLPSLIYRSYQRLIGDKSFKCVDKALVQRLRDQFEVLVNKQYIERCPVFGTTLDSTIRFAPPRIELVTLMSFVSSQQTDSTDNVYWTVNYDRFHQDIRDELLVNAIARRISLDTGEVMALLLRQAYILSPSDAPRSIPVSLTTLKDNFRKSQLDIKHFEEHLTVIAEDKCGFVRKDDLSANTAYIVYMQDAIEELAWTVLASTVEVRYGVSAARIFRLVRKEEYIEQDEIQKRAMLPDKECKFITYSLVQGGFLQQQELRKTLQKSGPTKNFFLFCVNLSQVTRMYVETCYRSLYNCIARREHVSNTHSALLDKQQRIDAISHHMEVRGADPQDIAEIKELITPAETTQLTGIYTTINKLHQVELEIDSTLFILELYLNTRS